MKIEVKKVDTLTRELKFEVPKDRVTQTLDEVYKDIGKKAKIKGFRPGKAPRQVLEAHHSKVAHEETINKIIPEVYHEGIHQEKISPMDMPQIENVSFKDGVISFTAKVDIKPEIKLKNYKEIPVKRKDPKVTDEEMNKTLEFFKKGQGEDKKIEINDDFAHSLGYPNLEDFKNSLRRQMEVDKERQNRLDVENQIIDYVIKNSTFSIPQNIVTKQIEKRLKETQDRMRQQGTSDEDIKNKEEQMQKELKPVVERDIKAYLIFERIAMDENIEIKQGESMPQKVLAFLLKEAKWEEK